VPVRAAAAASVVVAAALALAGLALLGVLRADLRDAAMAQAAADANQLAMAIKAGAVPADVVNAQPLAAAVLDDQGRVIASTSASGAAGGVPGLTTAVPLTVPEALASSPGTAGDKATASNKAGANTPGSKGKIGSTGDTGTGIGVPATTSTDKATAAVAKAVPAAQPGVAKALTTVNGKQAVVYTAVSSATESGALAAARTAMLIGLPLLLAVVAGVTWLVTRRALRPVDDIRDELSAIMDSSDLARRVPEPAAQDAIGRLARTTNQTLAALQASLEQQHRFVADASHELRNPIASLRTQLEVGAAHPVLLDVPGAVKDVARLQQLAADLLLLARLDAGERPPAQSRVDLTELAREQVALASTVHGGAEGGGDGDGRAPVRTGELADLEVAGSARQLARILANLIDNAQRHATTEVVVSVRATPDAEPEAGDDNRATTRGRRAVIEVADDGDGVPEDQRERIFERFVRLDDARSRDDGGTGLGLAIARDLARRHGGTLTTSPRGGRGAVFTLELPLQPSDRTISSAS